MQYTLYTHVLSISRLYFCLFVILIHLVTCSVCTINFHRIIKSRNGHSQCYVLLIILCCFSRIQHVGSMLDAALHIFQLHAIPIRIRTRFDRFFVAVVFFFHVPHITNACTVECKGKRIYGILRISYFIEPVQEGQMNSLFDQIYKVCLFFFCLRVFFRSHSDACRARAI